MDLRFLWCHVLLNKHVLDCNYKFLGSLKYMNYKMTKQILEKEKKTYSILK